ncbi:ZYBA0S11-00848g1_1 [Zygosaccharomyces bailii CLIB 213]|uniref:Large ribosomal subunit protein mL49 n=1 Tax=Zygosaccharomyces bailii (strain CLIB 213 / ATCC 58445 / CBS 680 / BCRC 21525 / NBRC 1098 / NCYC 1416 / NRRL Y-2227) TaxID=1333698 RepID=A0A8J2TAC4_ZYGB2|nr:ZYBA0S11-00848g1_1 [Zygosaccharomyces bailii CLIB 213]
MLRTVASRSLQRSLLRPIIRCQSTVENASAGNEISTLETETKEFSVFPRIQDIQINELVGNNSFGEGKYFVQRSTTGNLPVYLDVKNGGSITTEVRKVEGDVVKLRDDLQEQLPHIPKKSWKCILQSNKIVIKGDVVKDLKRVLAETF